MSHQVIRHVIININIIIIIIIIIIKAINVYHDNN